MFGVTTYVIIVIFFFQIRGVKKEEIKRCTLSKLSSIRSEETSGP